MGQLLADLDLLIRAGDGQSLLICIDSHVLNSLSAGLNHAVYDVVAGPADANDFDGDDIFRTGALLLYNGTPSGFENICEDENNKTKPYVLHAEANAITKVAKSNNSSLGATLYVTASPCIECAKLIIQAGIRRVVYSENYRSIDGIELLQKAGIDVAFIELSENQENKD